MRKVIPLNKLILSAHNARKTNLDFEIEEMAASILAKGLLQNLVVSEGLADKIFEVDAGGRRFRAMQLLAARKDIKRDFPVDCLVVPREDALEASVAENTLKVAMNPADEVVAYEAILQRYADSGVADRGEQVLKLSRRFGRTIHYIEQRLALAQLSPPILEALRLEYISIEVARAYAGHPDQAEQHKVFLAEEKKDEAWRHSVKAVRDAIAGRIYAIDHKAVRYVGLEAYEAAGGRVRADLFMGEADRLQILDPWLIDQLAEGKATSEAAAAASEQGWSGAVLSPWSGPAHLEAKAPKGFQRKYGGAVTLPADARGDAKLTFRIADDATLAIDRDCFVPEAAPTPQAKPSSRDWEAEHRAQERKLLVETTAARLAVPSVDGTPFEGRAFWPAEDRQHDIDAIETDQATGDFILVMLVKVPAADVVAQRERAEWEVAEREQVAIAAAAGPDDEDEQSPVNDVAELKVEGVVA